MKGSTYGQAVPIPTIQPTTQKQVGRHVTFIHALAFVIGFSLVFTCSLARWSCCWGHTLINICRAAKVWRYPACDLCAGDLVRLRG
jgi:hypothetical protein